MKIEKIKRYWYDYRDNDRNKFVFLMP